MAEIVVKEKYNEYPKIYSTGDFSNAVKSPLANCQTYSIGGIQSILDDKDALDILKAYQKTIEKTQLLVDLYPSYLPKLKKIFTDPEDFIIEAPYINSTRKPMVLCLIKTDKLKATK